MRLVDADALETHEQLEPMGNGMYEYVQVVYKDDIDDAPTIEPEQRWIPCSERLPEDKTAYYLATIANYGSFFTTTLPEEVNLVRWDYDRRKGKNSWHWCTERTVTAWMPLPEPYREEGEK